jgi:hypothetical protein
VGFGIPQWRKLNGTNQLVVYFDDASILGGRLRMLKENAETLIVDRKEI